MLCNITIILNIEYLTNFVPCECKSRISSDTRSYALLKGIARSGGSTYQTSGTKKKASSFNNHQHGGKRPNTLPTTKGNNGQYYEEDSRFDSEDRRENGEYYSSQSEEDAEEEEQQSSFLGEYDDKNEEELDSSQSSSSSNDRMDTDITITSQNDDDNSSISLMSPQRGNTADLLMEEIVNAQKLYKEYSHTEIKIKKEDRCEMKNMTSSLYMHINHCFRNVIFFVDTGKDYEEPCFVGRENEDSQTRCIAENLMVLSGKIRSEKQFQCWCFHIYSSQLTLMS